MAADPDDPAARVVHAMEREIKAHERAIEMQEAAAAGQIRLGHPDRAAAARRRAERARQLLAEAQDELHRFQNRKTPQAGG
jgi:hypothetical protein